MDGKSRWSGNRMLPSPSPKPMLTDTAACCFTKLTNWMTNIGTKPERSSWGKLRKFSLRRKTSISHVASPSSKRKRYDQCFIYQSVFFFYFLDDGCIDGLLLGGCCLGCRLLLLFVFLTRFSHEFLIPGDHLLSLVLHQVVFLLYVKYKLPIASLSDSSSGLESCLTRTIFLLVIPF